MNKTCNNVDNAVSQIQRCLGNLYKLSFEIRLLMDSGIIDFNGDAYLDKLTALCQVLETEADVSPDFQKLVDSIPMISDILSDDELMDLEFIRAFGSNEFAEVVVTTKDFDCVDKLIALQESIEFKCFALFTFFDLIDFTFLESSSLCFKNLKRKQRRASETKARTHAIQLGSDDIYSGTQREDESEDKKLVRKCGFIGYKVKKAESNLREYDKKKKKGILLFSKLELKAFRKTIRKGKKYVKFAEKYKDYTILYNGRYFTSMEKAISVAEPEVSDIVPAKGTKKICYVRLSEDCLDSKYRQSGLYAKIEDNDTSMIDGLESKGLTDELLSSEKGDVPMSVRRNKHQVTVCRVDPKITISKEERIDISSTCYATLNKISLSLGISPGFL